MERPGASCGARGQRAWGGEAVPGPMKSAWAVVQSGPETLACPRPEEPAEPAKWHVSTCSRCSSQASGSWQPRWWGCEVNGAGAGVAACVLQVPRSCKAALRSCRRRGSNRGKGVLMRGGRTKLPAFASRPKRRPAGWGKVGRQLGVTTVASLNHTSRPRTSINATVRSRESSANSPGPLPCPIAAPQPSPRVR